MLDQEARRSIDAARDVLVGKVPDPKAQVEQITIALIFKFMDDIDRESEKLGGKATFFVDYIDATEEDEEKKEKKYAQYSWRKLMHGTCTSEQKLSLYGEALEMLPKHSQIPQFFRDIFKGAFLPFRDARTLRLFLNEINNFTYDNSESLGNAFEYLLSIMGSQGNAGQFRTPRHIIDFVVEAVNPQKDHSILDPECGTAGFLISAYKHIVEQNSDLTLTPNEKTELGKSIVGYDISPDMVRLALVNLYLHKFVEPKIYEYDTLTSDIRWKDDFDIILANPPFMTPKGGITPHKEFSVDAKRSEVLFVDYIAEHLCPNGRAGIIVPEGIVFQTAHAYKALRKKLIEDWGLYAVVSLPSGVFQPYSGVKTSILFLDRAIHKQGRDEVLFVKVEHDGYDLGAQRRPVEKNDLPEALRALQRWQKTQELEENNTHAFAAKKARIAEDGQYNLSAERYRETTDYRNAKWPLVALGEVLVYEQPTNYIVSSTDYKHEYKIPVLTAGKSFILGYTNEIENIFPNEKLPVIIFDDFTTAIKFVNFSFKVKSSAMKILKANEKANVKFVFYMMQKIQFIPTQHKRYWISEYSNLKIPLPPLEVQEHIVEEITQCQSVIDGTKQVTEHWKPRFTIDAQWPLVALGEVCEIQRGGSPRPIEKYITKDENGINWIKIGDVAVEDKYVTKTKQKIKREGVSSTRLVKEGDFILSNSMSFGRPYIVKINGAIHDGWLLIRITDKQQITTDFLYQILGTKFLQEQYLRLARGGTVKNLNKDLVKSVQIPLPPLEVQERIVAEIDAEQQAVEQCKTLAQAMQKKIDAILAELW